MLEEQDVTESGGWIIYFNLTHRLDGVLALGCSAGNLKHGGVSTVLGHVPLAAASPPHAAGAASASAVTLHSTADPTLSASQKTLWFVSHAQSTKHVAALIEFRNPAH